MSMFPSLYAADIKFKVKLFSSSGTIISSQEDSFAKADHLMLENIKRAREAGYQHLDGTISLVINYRDSLGPVKVYHNTLALCEYDENGQSGSIDLLYT